MSYTTILSIVNIVLLAIKQITDLVKPEWNVLTEMWYSALTILANAIVATIAYQDNKKLAK